MSHLTFYVPVPMSDTSRHNHAILRPYQLMVIGNPIAHSQSPKIHQTFAQQVGLSISYARQWCPDNIESFQAVVEAFFNGGGHGANVTVPFKQMAYQLCQDNLTEEALVAGAVNTLYLQAEDKNIDGDTQALKLCGHNTDGIGLVSHLKQLNWSLQDKKIAIIGAGGASRGVILPLLSAGVDCIHIANRTVHKAERLIQECRQQSQYLSQERAQLINQAQLSYGGIEELTGYYDVIINATSIGLSDNRLPLSEALSCGYAYDMMYGKALPFLQHFELLGAEVSDGYGMLIHQAVFSFEKWTGQSVDVNQLRLLS